MYNFSDYQPTFNKQIDFCANLIACARQQNRPIKTLSLKPVNFEWFKSGVKTLMDHAKAPKEDIESVDNENVLMFDGVNIEKGSIFQSKPIIIEYYAGLN